MSSEKFNLESLFEATVNIQDPDERAAFIDQHCGSDLELRLELQRLLESDHQAGSFLNHPPADVAATLATDSDGVNSMAAMEAGLAAAFDFDAAVIVGNTGHSVLRTLGQTLDNVPKVALRNLDANAPDPIVNPKSSEIPSNGTEKRYQLQGEIARGGMGVVIKGHDNDLGRDLAIKVLLDVHKDKPEVIHRFVEEAQIGGQLQHPGIAPVYELGAFAQSRRTVRRAFLSNGSSADRGTFSSPRFLCPGVDSSRNIHIRQ